MFFFIAYITRVVYLMLGSAQWLTFSIYFTGGPFHPMEDPLLFHLMEDPFNPLFPHEMAVHLGGNQLMRSTNHPVPSLKSLTSGKF